MKNRINKTKAAKRTKAKRAPKQKLRTEYMLSLAVWELDENGIGDGDDVASVDIPIKLFTDILSRANSLGITPGQFLEEMVADSVRYNSATVERLGVA